MLTIAHDGRMTVSESELLRAICAVLHCPLPPLYQGDAHLPQGDAHLYKKVTVTFSDKVSVPLVQCQRPRIRPKRVNCTV